MFNIDSISYFIVIYSLVIAKNSNNFSLTVSDNKYAKEDENDNFYAGVHKWYQNTWPPKQ